MFLEIGSTSHSTGIAPQCMITLTVLQKVIAEVITSSPGPIPKDFSAKNRADVHEEMAAENSEDLY